VQEESSEARNTKQVATSSGSPARPKGVSEPNVATSLAGKVEGISGVQIGPGATAFTRFFFREGLGQGASESDDRAFG